MKNQKIESAVEEIEILRARKTQQKKEIKRLEYENNSKMEMCARDDDKIQELECELRERRKELKYLKDGDAKNMTKAVKREKENAFTSQTLTMLDNDVMFLEKFQTLLDAKLSHMDNQFRDSGKDAGDEHIDDPDLDFYAKSNIRTISIRYMSTIKNKKNEETSDYISIRYSPTTRFCDIIELVCKFWKLDSRIHELTDESNSQLPLDEYVETFIRARSQESSPVLVILRTKETTCQILNPAMQDAIRLSEAVQKKKIDEVNFQRDHREEIDKYKEFFAKFPGMRSYIDSNKVREKENDFAKKKLVIRTTNYYENHCCIVFVMITLMALTMKTLFYEFNVYEAYYDVASIQNIFGVSNDLMNLGTDQSKGIFYSNITGADKMWEYISTRLTKAFFRDVSNGVSSDSDFLSKNTVIGPLRMKSMMVTEKPCQKMQNVIFDVSCYYDYYDEQTRHTKTLGDGTQPWMYFKTADETGEITVLNGYFSSYDGSGYVVDIDPDYMTANNFRNLVDELRSNNFVGINTRAFVLSINMYNIPGDYLILAQMLIEFDVVGGIRTNPIAIRKFGFNLYTTGKLDHLGYDVIKGMLATIIFIYIVFNIFFSEKKKIRVNYLLTAYGSLNLIIAIFTFMGIAKTAQFNSNKLSPEIINTQFYLDLRTAADQYYDIFFWQALAGSILLIRITYFLKMYAEFEIIFVALEKTGKLIISYCLIVIPVLLSFGISGMVLWAPISVSYVNLQNAFLSSILLALGRFDRNILIQADYLPTIIYITIYYLFVIFFLITVLVGLYVDNYRITMMDYGYNFAKFTQKRTVKDLIKWLFAWVPNQVTRYIEELQRRNKLKKLLKLEQENLKKENAAKNANKPKTKEKTLVDDDDKNSPEENELIALGSPLNDKDIKDANIKATSNLNQNSTDANIMSDQEKISGKIAHGNLNDPININNDGLNNNNTEIDKKLDGDEMNGNNGLDEKSPERHRLRKKTMGDIKPIQLPELL